MIDIGLVLQAGGNGTRFIDINIPKPIYPLSGKGETCLSNILENVPEHTHVFLHIHPKQEAMYREYMEQNDVRAGMHYIHQDIGFLYALNGEVRTFNGKHVFASNGPGNFSPRLREIIDRQDIAIEYVAVYDGCKRGLCYDDIKDGIEKLVIEGKKALVYTKRISQNKTAAENGNSRKAKNPRYDLVLETDVYGKNVQCVYEKRCTPFDVARNPNARALTGLNIFHYHALMEKAISMRGTTIDVLDFKQGGKTAAPGLSYYYDFRITNLIKAFDSDELLFVEQPQEHYYTSIKVPEDL